MTFSLRGYGRRQRIDSVRLGSRGRRGRRLWGLEGLEDRVLLSAISWTGDAGDNNWDTPGNWSDDAVPGSADDVTINISANVVHSAGVTDTINSLTSSEPLSITGGTLSIASASTISSTLTVNYQTNNVPTLTVNGTLDVSGLLTLGFCTLSGSGSVTAEGGIVINGVGPTLDGITINNAAGQTATCSSTRSLPTYDGATFNNLGTYISTNSRGFSDENDGSGPYPGPLPAFNNEGSFVESSSSSAADTFTATAFNSDGGTVDVQGGTLNLFGGGTVTNSTFTTEAGATLILEGGDTVTSSTFTVAAGATLDLGDHPGTTSFDAASAIEGAGTVEFFEDGTTTLDGSYDVTGATIGDSSGTVNFDGTVDSIGASLTNDEGTLNFNTPFAGTAGTIVSVDVAGGTLNLGANDLSATTLKIAAGELVEMGTITASGLSTFSGGSLSGSGDVDADGGIDFGSGSFTLDGRTLNNAVGQTATWSPGGQTGIALPDGAVINNFGTFLMQSQNLGGLYATISPGGAGAAPTFNNDGTITAAGGATGRFLIDVPVDTAGGTVDVKSGTLELEVGGTSTGSTFTVESGATLFLGGTSTLDDNSPIEGAGNVTFATSDTITLNGAYDITGTTFVTDSGTVDLNGPIDSIGASLTVDGGTLNLNGPFSASAGTIPSVTIDGVVYQATVNFGTNDLNATTLTTKAGGGLNETGTITVSGLLTLDGGTLSGSGAVDANAGITMGNPQDYYDGDVVLDGRTLNNASGQTLTCGLGIDFDDGAVLNNFGTFISTFYEFGDGDYFSGGMSQVSGAASTFNNMGSFIVTADTVVGDAHNGFTVVGVAFNVDGGTVDVKAGTLTLFRGGGLSTGGAFTIESGATLNISINPYTFDINTTLTGAGGLTIDEQGTVLLLGTSALTGPNDIVEGALQVDGSQPDSAVSVGGTLSGTGTVGAITNDGGTISPGDGATVTGTLTADGAVSLASGSFNVAINGATAGTDYDQLNANGSVNLGSSTLTGSLGFTPAAGETFTIIKSTAPIVGTFNGLPEGASVTIGGVAFTISYAADGGDAVVLTSTAAPTLATETTMDSSANPATAGQPVTFTANVFGPSGAGKPTGSVSFQEGSTVLWTSILDSSGQATFTTSTLAVGSDPITAVYTPTGNFQGSSSTTLVQTIEAPGLKSATTTLYLSANPATAGQSITLWAIVYSPGIPIPTGTVTFTIDGQAETPAPLSAGNSPIGYVDQASFSTSSLAVGTHTIGATYSGDSNFAESNAAPMTQTINAPALESTTTSLSSSANPSTVGQGVTFTAVVAPASGTGTPTGTVTFTIDGQAETPSALSVVNGVDEATFTTTSLAAGPHTISAAYSGDTAFASSTVATPLTETVSTPALQATEAQLTSSANPATAGQGVTFTAVVAPASGTGTPTGTVTFTIDGKAGTPVPLSEVSGRDQATLTIPTLATGSHTILASYSGDPSFAPSQSSQQTQVVSPSSSPATGTTSPSPVVTDGPKVVSVLRYGYHMMPTSLVMTFDQALDATTAQDDENYRIIGPAGRVIGIESAVYDPTTQTVTLHTRKRINIHYAYELIVDGTAPHGLTNTPGQLLDGADTGQPGSDDRASLTWRNLVLDPPPNTSHWSKRTTVNPKSRIASRDPVSHATVPGHER